MTGLFFPNSLQSSRLIKIVITNLLVKSLTGAIELIDVLGVVMKIITAFIFLFSSFCICTLASAQQDTPKTELLMTIEAKFDAPVVIDQSMRIVNIPSGTISGPNFKGTVQSPSADWVQVLPSGALRTDVRLLIKTDDGENIYVSYNGVVKHSEKSLSNLRKGEEATSDDGMYFLTAPTFRTSSKKYDYLNSIQAINVVKVMRLGANGGYGVVNVYAVK